MKGANHKSSLARRLIGRLSVAIAVVSIIGGAVVAVFTARTERLALENESDLAITHLASILEKPLWDLDVERITMIGEAFSRDSRISSLTCRGEAGEKLYFSQREDGERSIGRHAVVSHDGKKIGEVEVAFSTKSYHGQTWRIIQATALTVGLILIIVFLTTGFLVKTQLRLPLDQLSQIVSAYGAGEYSREAQTISFHEFQRFETVLLEMGERIHGQLQQLRTLNSMLALKNDSLTALQKELREGEDRYRLLVEESPDMIGIYQAGKLAFLNSTGVRLLGAKTTGELLGMTSEQVFHPEDRAAAMERLRRRAAGETGMYPVEVRYQRLDGTILPVEVSATPISFGGKPAVQFIARDITERKQAEVIRETLLSLATRLSEARTPKEVARSIFAMADRLWRWDAGILDLCSPATDLTETVLGMDIVAGERREVPPAGTPGPTTPRMRRVLTQGAELILRPQPSAPVADSVRFGDTSRPSASLLYVPIRRQGRAVGVLSIQSYTPNAFTEEDLQTLQVLADYCGGALERIQSEREQALLSDTIRASLNEIYIFNADTLRFRFVNDGALANLGYTLEQVRQMTPLDLKPEFTAEAFALLVEPLRRGTKAKQVFQTVHRRADGSLYPVEVCLQLFDHGGDRVFLAVMQDITERKRVEQELQAQRDFAQLVMTTMGQGLTITDAQGCFEFVNPAFAKMAGRSPQDLLGRHPEEVTAPEDRSILTQQWTRRQQGETSTYETRLVRADGSVTYALINAVPRWREGKIAGSIAVITDLTERKLLQIRREHERNVLELIARGGSLPDLLERLVLSYETIFPGLRGSVLLLEPTGQHLRHGAAPHLPPAYCQAIDGVKIGPSVGSCGTAAYTGKTVIVADIAHDPLWRDFKDLALAHGLRACWSVPILGTSGRVLGTFAFYDHAPRAALPEELLAIERGAQLASLAIERKQAEEAVQRSRQQLEFAIEGSGVGLWDWTLPGGDTIFNERACEMLGYNLPELSPMNQEVWEQLCHPDDLKKARELLLQHFAGQTTFFECEERLRHKDGHWVWVLDRGRVTARDAQGQPTRMTGTHLDITERKRAEEALAMMRFSVDRAGDSIFWLSREGRIRYVNDAACASRGYTREELLGMTIFDLDPDYQPGVWGPHFEDLKRRGTITLETRHRAKDGRVFPIEVNANYVHVDGQEFNFCCLRDITERKRAEARISEQAALLNAANDAIYVRTLDQTVTYWNHGAERLYGWSRAEALGRKITELGDLDHATFAAAHAVLLEHGHWSGELKKASQTGTEQVVFCRWTLLRDEQGQPKEILAINTDITEAKQLETQFLRVQRLEGIGALAGGIAHDLNNILAPILMIAPLLRETASDSEGRAMLDTVESCAQRGADIIKQLLTFARGKPGTRVPLPMRHLLLEMEKIIRETFPRNIQPHVNTAKDLWLVLGDATQIHQALMNLCVNARDAMPDGGPLTMQAENFTLDESAAAAMPDTKPGPYVRVSVADSGTGIPPEHLDRIFDPFFTTKEIGKGTGLGLATVIGIVRGHSGFVRVNSRVGRGTIFELAFPAVREANPATPADAGILPPRGQGELILVVDDEISVRKVIQRTLEKQGYRVVTAAEGREALVLFTRHRAEIKSILTDMMMPGMDGPALIRALHELSPRLPVIGMTGLAERGGVKGLEGLALAGLLPKPFVVGELLTTLHRVLEAGTAETSPTD